MRKTFILTLIILFALAAPAAASGLSEAFSSGLASFNTPADGIAIYVDGKLLTPDVPAFIDRNNRTQAPFRAIGEALGAKVTWVPEGKKVLVEKPGLQVEMTIGSKEFRVNGQLKQMDTAPIIKNSRTFIPVRFLGEALLCGVQWDAATQTVIISSTAGMTGEVPGEATQHEDYSDAPANTDNVIEIPDGGGWTDTTPATDSGYVPWSEVHNY